MSRITDFFQDGDKQFGVFYPTHYLLAVYPNPADADSAQAKLRQAGRAEDDVISVSGEEVVKFADDHFLRDGLWGMLMTQLSRMIGTEAAYADKDLAAAKEGAAFVGVYCPTDDFMAEAWKSLEPTHPLVARYYTLGGIEHLAGEN